MNASHMIVDSMAIGKSLETFPTDVCLAASAFHMVTTFRSLNRDFTSRAVLYIVFLHPCLKPVVAAVRIRADEAIMRFNMAARAYSKQARGTLKDSPPARCTIDLGAIGGRAMMKFVGSGLDIREKCGVYNGIEVMPKEELLCNPQWDALSTFGVVSETTEREILVVD